MNKEGRNQQTAQAGEHYVAAELNRRGAYAVTFAGNMPRIDILASNVTQTRTVSIQIKTRRAGTWQCSITDGEKCKRKSNEDVFWVFVDLSKDRNPPDYYVVPDWWIRNNIHETHDAYLKKRFGKRAVTLDSKHHAVNHPRLAKWKGRWDILKIIDA